MEHSRLEASGDDRFALERQFVQYRPDPCRDGRFSDGRPRSCAELRRWLDDGGDPGWRKHREGLSWAERRRRICTDGRFSDGHAHTCDELMERYHPQDED
ncbi:MULTISPECIES: hypothetical protein [Ensifer]|jgi:hypothetical protein|uniref:Uncharacterized protein n=2 Tax=Ensifer canadensis TaxID=555315 RepID=A0AAW4FLQ5_9HYPH|nr:MULTISPECIES: hypothetical protein [Ensifer]MBD9487442.1 hypothetical protein [Ensifer sp. ENS11]MBM3092004.1 hypothetical protein [Ensifer canadensis]MDP9633693.1 hypothetical protein [Ensifer adhaerens]UBI77275.1 hypothetical protein J3R84_09295 [Ensifer canadensis]